MRKISSLQLQILMCICVLFFLKSEAYAYEYGSTAPDSSVPSFNKRIAAFGPKAQFAFNYPGGWDFGGGMFFLYEAQTDWWLDTAIQYKSFHGLLPEGIRKNAQKKAVKDPSDGSFQYFSLRIGMRRYMFLNNTVYATAGIEPGMTLKQSPALVACNNASSDNVAFGSGFAGIGITLASGLNAESCICGYIMGNGVKGFRVEASVSYDIGALL